MLLFCAFLKPWETLGKQWKKLLIISKTVDKNSLKARSFITILWVFVFFLLDYFLLSAGRHKKFNYFPDLVFDSSQISQS